MWWGAQGGVIDAADAADVTEAATNAATNATTNATTVLPTLLPCYGTDATVWIRGEHWCTNNQHNTCLGHCLVLVVLIHAFDV